MPAIYAPRQDNRFPLKAVLLASFLPALLGLCCGLFITPPYLEHDTAEAILAWFNFTEGGAWNTIVHVDPNDISQSIEKSVTWWPPGQYIPLGLLHSAGLSLGVSILILAFCATFLGSLGVAILAKALGAPKRTLPWIAVSVSTSYHALIGFNIFLGGDSALFMLTPWLILTAWRLRNCGYILCLALPSIFLLGTYIKHAFPIIAGAILLLLWMDRLSEDSRKKGKLRIKDILHSDLPLLLSGAIYIVLRYSLFNLENSPTHHVGQEYNFSPQTIISSNSIGPIMASGNIDAVSRLIKRAPETLRETLDLILLLVSPLTIGFYIWLSTKRSGLLRLAGIASIAYVICIAWFHFSGVSVDDSIRHFQIPGILLTACLAAQTAREGWQGKIAKLVVVGSILAGGWTLTKRSVFLQDYTLPTIQHLGMKASKEVLEKLEEIAADPRDKIVAITVPMQAVYFHFTSHSSTRFIFITHATRQLHEPHKGNVPYIIIPHHKGQLEENRLSRACFVDYNENEWDTYIVGDWIFSEVRPVHSDSGD